MDTAFHVISYAYRNLVGVTTDLSDIACSNQLHAKSFFLLFPAAIWLYVVS